MAISLVSQALCPENMMNYLTIETGMYLRPSEHLELHDSIIPHDVKLVLMESDPEHTTVVIDKGIIWVTSNSVVKFSKIDELNEFELSYQSPAKGGGCVYIEAKSILKDGTRFRALDFGVYSQQALSSGVYAAHTIGFYLGYNLRISYHGSDC